MGEYWGIFSGRKRAGALLKKGQNERYLKTDKMSVSWRMKQKTTPENSLDRVAMECR